jgi:hypothetical protein
MDVGEETGWRSWTSGWKSEMEMESLSGSKTATLVSGLLEKLYGQHFLYANSGLSFT